MNAETYSVRLKNSVVASVLVSNKVYSNFSEILKKVGDKKMLYIAISKPYSTLLKEFKKKGVDSSNIFFIDVVSKSIKSSIKDTENCVYIDKPDDLTKLNLVISDILNKHKDIKLVVFDSVSLLMAYRKMNDVVKFIHFLSMKFRVQEVDCFFLFIREEVESKLANYLTMFTDKVIELNGRK